MSEQREAIDFDQRGSMTALSMFICLLLSVLYLRGGRELMSAHLPADLHLLLISLVAVMTVFTVGLQIHLILSGEQSPRQLRRTLRRQIKELSLITEAALERLARIEDTVSWQSRLVRPVAYDHASRAQELINRLIHRGRAVEKLLAAKSKEKLFEAAELIGSPLAAYESSLDSLIKARPMPTLESAQWIPTLEQVLSAAEFEVEKSEERLRRKAA
jgi:hypothetical protein